MIKEINVYIEPFGLVPTNFGSYRGYYDELSLNYDTEGHCTVESLLNAAKCCIGKAFYGYKGGVFVMDESTPIWISNYGKVTDQKLDLIDVEGWAVYLLTRNES